MVVGTPGRVLDLIRRGELRLDRVHTVILDEADRMLDMGFIVDVETILSRCPRSRQTALFSATMPYAILRICDRFMDRKAEHIVVRPEMRTVETVRQLVYFVAEQDKVACARGADRRSSASTGCSSSAIPRSASTSWPSP